MNHLFLPWAQMTVWIHKKGQKKAIEPSKAEWSKMFFSEIDTQKYSLVEDDVGSPLPWFKNLWMNRSIKKIIRRVFIVTFEFISFYHVPLFIKHKKMCITSDWITNHLWYNMMENNMRKKHIYMTGSICCIAEISRTL